MSANYDKLKKLLIELFQLDQAELDFGIYRIMNQKRSEIVQFLDNDLLPQVKHDFAQYQPADKAEIQKDLDKVTAGILEAGMDPEQSPKVKELRAKLADSVDITALENEVFSDLYNFFRRYYDKGDFISMRRYKEGVYAIPYEGEEVKLYWANHDQYYIKTSEYFHNYSFRLPSGKRVCFFKLIEADVEKDNIKTEAGKERRFILTESEPLKEENHELIVRFEYRPDAGKRDQKTINEETVKIILGYEGFKDWQQELARLNPTEKNQNRTLLEKHLTDYTARNTFDYFIHKDLRKFLRRELDFYIKNEIMHLDDIEEESVSHAEQYLSKIRVIRKIAHKIIEFLAQIENFQKKLWLKKKFVVETNYCITLDRVPAEFYPEIAAKETQHDEWVRLFAIDEIGDDMHALAYSNPITVDFLKANDKLVLDTRFFNDDFKARLIASIENLDEQCGGLLIHSENFQALNLLGKKYRKQIKCVYIDPPYNSPSSEIVYKNNYKHSSWLSLMQDRLIATLPIQDSTCSCVVAIDKNEGNGLQRLMYEIYLDWDVTAVAIEHNKKGVQGDHFSYSSEFAIFAIPNDLRNLNRTQLPESEWDYSNLRNWGGESLRTDGRNCFYPIYVRNGDIVGFGEVCDDSFHPIGSNIEHADGAIEIYPIDAQGVERKWRYARDTVEGIKHLLKVDTARNGELQVMKAKADAQFKTMWYDTRYNAGDYGTKTLTNMGFEKGLFDFPKSLYTVRDCIFAVSDSSAIVLDYFAGSGTTGHAVITLNREDGQKGKRKYILVEMGDHFDSVLKPRIQKVIYSKDWEDGKPVSREGSSHMFKYVRLESYEDTLNNLEIKRTDAQQSLLEQSASFRESYMLSYMLDVESRGSLLNVKAFEDPFNYKLNISTGSVGETKPVAVDLVETFHYLIGLTVKHIDDIRGIKVVEGTNPKGQKTLVLWRKVSEMDNDKLDAWFKKQKYNTKDMEYDLIYVNGDNNLENLRREDMTWKVRLIEEEFHRLMFDVQDVYE